MNFDKNNNFMTELKFEFLQNYVVEIKTSGFLKIFKLFSLVQKRLKYSIWWCNFFKIQLKKYHKNNIISLS